MDALINILKQGPNKKVAIHKAAVRSGKQVILCYMQISISRLHFYEAICYVCTLHLMVCCSGNERSGSSACIYLNQATSGPSEIWRTSRSVSGSVVRDAKEA